MSKPIVAVVGRPNVGKSTLFNSLCGQQISIVKDTPGVTRDRIYAEVSWLNHNFTLIETGGIEPDTGDIILSQMREQAEIAIETADVIIFMTDVKQGLVDSDSKVADMLRRSHKPVILVVNKVDSFEKMMPDVYEFYNLGIGEPFPISAVNKLGFGEVLDEVVVTALGIKREEKALGYAVQKVGGSKLSTVKPVNIATSLTGKVAGLNVTNSTEFNTAPTLKLRGETPLLVVDGVPYSNISLNDIAADDIESVDVLKGATASALYGARGGSGAIMVTTKKGSQEGLNISVNSSTMFNAGYLVLPEVQHGYSTGQAGKYTAADFVWGDKLDIGRTAVQYDPYTYEW